MLSYVHAGQVLNRVGIAKVNSTLKPEADGISSYMWLKRVWTPFSFNHNFRLEWAMLSYCIEVVLAAYTMTVPCILQQCSDHRYDDNDSVLL